MYFNFIKLNLIQFFYVEPYATAIFVGKRGQKEAISHSSSQSFACGAQLKFRPMSVAPSVSGPTACDDLAYYLPHGRKMVVTKMPSLQEIQWHQGRHPGGRSLKTSNAEQ